MTIGIIGGGASGMAAALAAAENPKAEIFLFERQARLGRKLQATGNGRCNLSNLYMRPYHGANPEFAQAALEAFPPEKTLEWFRQLGLFTVVENSGRVYPYSDQANSVTEVLIMALNQPNIHIFSGFEVTRIRKTEAGFCIENGAESHLCHKLIIACGGLAGTKLGGSMFGYKFLSRFGHRYGKLRPALVQLKTDWSGIVHLKGIRANCHAAIFHDGQLFSQSLGEIQLTEQGVSGPVIYEISRDVCQAPGDWVCQLDFLPDFGEKQLLSELERRQTMDFHPEELLTGILHSRIGRIICKMAGSLEEIAHLAKCFELHLTEPLGMEAAQVTAGGVETDGFDPITLESRLVPGLYACGEVLDIDGDCGGYNLQWAWSSGRCAGLHAGKETT